MVQSYHHLQKKINFISLKSDEDKLDIDKSETAPTGLSNDIKIDINTLPGDLTRQSDTVGIFFFLKKALYNILPSNIIDIESNVPTTKTLIQISQYSNEK